MVEKRRPPKTKPNSKRKLEDNEEADDFFVFGDDERKQQVVEGDESEDDAAKETAEEKRLRLAKAYLEQLGRTAQEEDIDTDNLDQETAELEADSDAEKDGRHFQAIAERLQASAAEAAGRLQRKLAHLVSVPGEVSEQPVRCWRSHRLSATAICLSSDDRVAYSVSKDGSIFQWDVETMKHTRMRRPGERLKGGGVVGDTPEGQTVAEPTGAPWMKRLRAQGATRALYSCAVSSDGAFLAVGGGDKKIHVFDVRSSAHVAAFTGHMDTISCLGWREGTHTLMSGSYDRSVKMWSVDDRAYMDSLFGHQAEVLSLDVGRGERAISCGADRTCRLWKIPEESQLVFRAPAQSQDCIRYITSSEWVTGACDGGLHLWGAIKKKPIFSVHNAHGGAAVAGVAGLDHTAAAGWLQSVGVCKGSDLVASGAGDGVLRLWRVEGSKAGGAGKLLEHGGIPVKGFVNGIAIARSARFVVAAVGQEPRMGRWLSVAGARNGVVLSKLTVSDE